MESISPYLLAAASAWLVAQSLKYLYTSLKTRRPGNLRQLYLSGSMPSAHSATVIALLVVVGCRDGMQSGLFGLGALFAAVVMYDAVMVRRSSGEQGKALVSLLAEQKSAVTRPRVALGHTPIEVVAGACVGAIVGLVVFLATS